MTTIHTLKSSFQSNQDYLSEKHILMTRLTINMIIKELNNNDININEKEVVKRYREIYNFQTLVDEYDEKYTDQLDALGEKGEMFDDDALVYLFMKIIDKNFDVHSICDIDYIANDIKELQVNECSYQQLLKQSNKILKRINKSHEYHQSNDLQGLFQPMMLDIEQFFTRIYLQSFEDIQNIKILEESYLQMIELHKNYSLSLRYGEIITKILSSLIMLDSKYTKYIQDVLDMYPTLQMNTYYAILDVLKKSNQTEYINQYLDQALKVECTSEQDKDLQNVIKMIFGQ